MVTVIFPAAGAGRRMRAGRNKALMELAGTPLLARTLLRFSACGAVDDFVVVAGADEVETVRAMLRDTPGLKPFRVVAGGAERQYSVQNGLAALSAETEIVLVHDAARPFVTPETIEAVARAARESGAAVAAARAKNTVKVVRADGVVDSTPDRAGLWEAHTPQGFRRGLLEEAYRRAARDGFLGTDDASLVERMGSPVRVVEDSDRNIKLTTPSDAAAAEALLRRKADGREQEAAMVRFGMGYDVHRLAEGRRLVLGGVEIPWEKGLLGHSDADVLLHAVADALLGAAALGDIGRHFPDTDARYKDADSLALLARVAALVAAAGYRVGNVDATVVAQAPRLAPHIGAMEENIARALGVARGAVNVKATTEERLGFTGRGDGMSAYAVAGLFARSGV